MTRQETLREIETSLKATVTARDKLYLDVVNYRSTLLQALDLLSRSRSPKAKKWAEEASEAIRREVLPGNSFMKPSVSKVAKY